MTRLLLSDSFNGSGGLVGHLPDVGGAWVDGGGGSGPLLTLNGGYASAIGAGSAGNYRVVTSTVAVDSPPANTGTLLTTLINFRSNPTGVGGLAAIINYGLNPFLGAVGGYVSVRLTSNSSGVWTLSVDNATTTILTTGVTLSGDTDYSMIVKTSLGLINPSYGHIATITITINGQTFTCSGFININDTTGYGFQSLLLQLYYGVKIYDVSVTDGDPYYQPFTPFWNKHNLTYEV